MKGEKIRHPFMDPNQEFLKIDTTCIEKMMKDIKPKDHNE
jgi:hypothetical protein